MQNKPAKIGLHLSGLTAICINDKFNNFEKRNDRVMAIKSFLNMAMFYIGLEPCEQGPFIQRFSFMGLVVSKMMTLEKQWYM